MMVLVVQGPAGVAVGVLLSQLLIVLDPIVAQKLLEVAICLEHPMCLYLRVLWLFFGGIYALTEGSRVVLVAIDAVENS